MGCQEFIFGFISPVPFYVFGNIAYIGIEIKRMEVMILFMLIGSIVTIIILSVSGYITISNGLSEQHVTILAKQVTSSTIFVLCAVCLRLSGPHPVLLSPISLSIASAITSAMCILIVAFSVKHAVSVCRATRQTLQV